MTSEERTLHDRRIDAEIANLLAETAKLNAETRKMTVESRYYLLVIGSGATLAITAFAKLFL